MAIVFVVVNAAVLPWFVLEDSVIQKSYPVQSPVALMWPWEFSDSEVRSCPRSLQWFDMVVPVALLRPWRFSD